MRIRYNTMLNIVDDSYILINIEWQSILWKNQKIYWQTRLFQPGRSNKIQCEKSG